MTPTEDLKLKLISREGEILLPKDGLCIICKS